MSTHDHHAPTEPAEPPAPPERIEQTFAITLTVSVNRASWADYYADPAEADLTEYVHSTLVTRLRSLIPSIELHDGRAEITVRP